MERLRVELDLKTFKALQTRATRERRALADEAWVVLAKALGTWLDQKDVKADDVAKPA
jgi:hypothetical protein